MRGEHYDRVYLNNWPEGSSPRARGAPQHVHYGVDAAGIIPACAGSTTRHAAGWLARGDHPRVRGEHLAKGTTVIPGVGSSPRARGALPGGWPGILQHWIIPACAGSTQTECDTQ